MVVRWSAPSGDADGSGLGVGARLAHVDALRGFALFGILVVNIGYMASTYHGSGLEDPGFGSALDGAVRWFVTVFFEAKFFLLFSFLFGYSFTLQLTSAERSGARFGPRFLRRLAGLYVLGVLHAVLLFPGDILTTYAVLGLILLAVRRIGPRTAVRTAVVLFAVTAALYVLLAVGVHLTGGAGVDPGAAAEAERAAEALRGGPGAVIGEHLGQLPDVVFLLAFFQAPAAFAAFLLGLAAGRAVCSGTSPATVRPWSGSSGRASRWGSSAAPCTPTRAWCAREARTRSSPSGSTSSPRRCSPPRTPPPCSASPRGASVGARWPYSDRWAA